MATDAEPEEYIKGGILGLRQVMVVAAPTGSFKSIFGLNMAHALGSGTKVFDRFEVTRPINVSIFDKEIGRVYLRQRLQKFYSNGKRPPSRVRISAPEDDETDFALDSPGSLDIFKREIETSQPNVIILDCLNPFIMGDESEETYSRVAKNVETLQKHFKELNLAFVILHHMREIGLGSDPLSMYSVRGHGKLVDWAATRVMMHRKPNTKETPEVMAKLVSRWVLRHGPEIPKLELQVKPNLQITTGEINLQEALKGL